MSIQPDWLDERIHLDEVPEHMAEAALARRALGFEATRAILTESDKQILRELPPDRFAAEVERRRKSARRIEAAEKNQRAPRRAVWGGAALAACIALFFMFTPAPVTSPVVSESGSQAAPPPSGTKPEAAPTTTPPNPDQVAIAPETGRVPGIRTKGEVSLVIQRETTDGLVAVSETDSLAAGSRLRLSVPESFAWAAIYSIDSRGEMAQHWPLQGDQATALPQGQLPRVWELDDVPGQECFVLVWSREPFGLDKIRKAIFLNRSKPRLKSGIETRIVRVRKSNETAR